MAILTIKAGPRRRRRDEANTYRLPQGEAIRRLLRVMFAEQRRRVLAAIQSRGRKDQAEIMPAFDFDPPLRLGQLDFSERFTPLISAIWDDAGRNFLARIEEDPDEWQVTDPNLQHMIQEAAYDFCDATNATTSRELNTALADLRREIVEGQATAGDTLRELTKRVNAIFDGAETWRARRIATSEASRATHAAEVESARQSEVVAGFGWLLSSDACDLCHRIKDEVGSVRLGEAFASIGDNPTYGTIRHPPAHPGCQCSLTHVLLPAYGGPENPEWGSQLVQPTRGE